MKILLLFLVLLSGCKFPDETHITQINKRGSRFVILNEEKIDYDNRFITITTYLDTHSNHEFICVYNNGCLYSTLIPDKN